MAMNCHVHVMLVYHLCHHHHVAGKPAVVSSASVFFLIPSALALYGPDVLYLTNSIKALAQLNSQIPTCSLPTHHFFM